MRSARRVVYTLDGTGDEVPTVAFDNFDINDPANFLIPTPASNTNYARYRLVTDRFDEISAARLDFRYSLEGFVQAGEDWRPLLGARANQRREQQHRSADSCGL